MPKKMSLLFLTMVLMGGGILAQDIVQFDEANPPFMYAKDGNASGVYPSLFKEAFTRMKANVSLGVVPWKRALDDTDNGRAGTGGIYQNSERLKKYDFSEPYFEERLAIFVQAGKVFKYAKIEDLYDKSFNVIRGWSYGDDFDTAAKAGKLTSDDSGVDDKANFKKLASGRNDAVIATVESGNAAIKALGLTGKVVMLPTYLSTSKVYLAFAKSAKKTAFLAEFNKAMASMTKDGTFASIVAANFQ